MVVSDFLFYNYRHRLLSHFFFFNDTATTEIYTLSLHDALPISSAGRITVPNVYQVHYVTYKVSLLYF